MELLPNKPAHIEINYCLTRPVNCLSCKEERGYSCLSCASGGTFPPNMPAPPVLGHFERIPHCLGDHRGSNQSGVFGTSATNGVRSGIDTLDFALEQHSVVHSGTI